EDYLPGPAARASGDVGCALNIGIGEYRGGLGSGRSGITHFHLQAFGVKRGVGSLAGAQARALQAHIGIAGSGRRRASGGRAVDKLDAAALIKLHLEAEIAELLRATSTRAGLAALDAVFAQALGLHLHADAAAAPAVGAVLAAGVGLGVALLIKQLLAAQPDNDFAGLEKYNAAERSSLGGVGKNAPCSVFVEKFLPARSLIPAGLHPAFCAGQYLPQETARFASRRNHPLPLSYLAAAHAGHAAGGTHRAVGPRPAARRPHLAGHYGHGGTSAGFPYHQAAAAGPGRDAAIPGASFYGRGGHLAAGAAGARVAVAVFCPLAGRRGRGAGRER
nr:hypothetical protein [Tanacetum cinerariifolium]